MSEIQQMHDQAEQLRAQRKLLRRRLREARKELDHELYLIREYLSIWDSSLNELRKTIASVKMWSHAIKDLEYEIYQVDQELRRLEREQAKAAAHNVVLVNFNPDRSHPI
jgi:hypothetical protein